MEFVVQAERNRATFVLGNVKLLHQRKEEGGVEGEQLLQDEHKTRYKPMPASEFCGTSSVTSRTFSVNYSVP